MKKFILSLFFVIFTLFNVCGEDLLHPVIRDDIDEDIKKIEQALVDYVFYPEMVERGFDVHHLDNMKIDGEMFEYIESFFRPNDEKGWLPLDNHHYLGIDDNGKWLTGSSYHKRVLFSNEYGTKDELLKKGYVENETMFYYPSNGEKDWRVGEWSWYDWYGEWNYNRATECNFEGMKEIKADYLYVLETKKSYVIKYNVGVDKYINENITSIPKKDYLIIDLLDGNGGRINEALKFVETIKKSKVKKIIVLTDRTISASEDIVNLLKDDKRVIYIGENTNGVFAGMNKKSVINEKNKINLKLSTKCSKYSISEGIGFIPDIWALNTLDIMKNLWRITEDYELKIKYNNQIIDHDNYQKYN